MPDLFARLRRRRVQRQWVRMVAREVRRSASRRQVMRRYAGRPPEK